MQDTNPNSAAFAWRGRSPGACEDPSPTQETWRADATIHGETILTFFEAFFIALFVLVLQLV